MNFRLLQNYKNTARPAWSDSHSIAGETPM
jgi:hypothetical protein